MRDAKSGGGFLRVGFPTLRDSPPCCRFAERTALLFLVVSRIGQAPKGTISTMQFEARP
jgi:hypothetical protein